MVVCLAGRPGEPGERGDDLTPGTSERSSEVSRGLERNKGGSALLSPPATALGRGDPYGAGRLLCFEDGRKQCALPAY